MNWWPGAHVSAREKTKARNQAQRRYRVKSSKRISLVLLGVVVLTVTVTGPLRLSAQTGPAKSSSDNSAASATQWSVQVVQVHTGNVNLAPSFQVAIYEDLLDELGKTKFFLMILRPPRSTLFPYSTHAVMPQTNG